MLPQLKYTQPFKYGGDDSISDINYVNDSDINFVKNCNYTINCLIAIIIVLMYTIYVLVNQNMTKKTKLTYITKLNTKLNN